MPYIMNALDEKVNVQAHGKWFSFNPRQIKHIENTNLALFMSMNRGEEGLVDISSDMMELEPTNPERIAHVEARRKEGVQKRINKLEWQRNNLIGSLRHDVELKGIKVDPLVYASEGDIKALQQLKVLKGNAATDLESNADKVKKLLGEIDGHINSADVGSADPGRANTAQPAKSGK